MKSSSLEYTEAIPVFGIRAGGDVPWDYLCSRSDPRSAAEIRAGSPTVTTYLYAPKLTSDHP